MARIYYHYTTADSMESIMRSGVIKMSTINLVNRKGDTICGQGDYLTRVPPSTPKQDIAYN